MKRKGLRAVSIYRNYGGPTAQAEEKMVLANGKEQILTKLLMAEPWTYGDVTEWERIKVMETFGQQFRGLTYDENPLHRLSTFDSLYAQSVHNWTDEEREIVENKIRTGPGNGVDYIVVDTPRVPAPWPAYDNLKVVGKRTVEMVAEKIAETVSELGIDPDRVLAYERENDNRPAVIAAVENLKKDAPAEELIQA